MTVVAATFDMLGLPLGNGATARCQRHGGRGGRVSGIRSLTGCLFAGSFLAALLLDRFWEKSRARGRSPGAGLCDQPRSEPLPHRGRNHGPESIAGVVHDLAGYAVLGVTALGCSRCCRC